MPTPYEIKQANKGLLSALGNEEGITVVSLDKAKEDAKLAVLKEKGIMSNDKDFTQAVSIENDKDFTKTTKKLRFESYVLKVLPAYIQTDKQLAITNPSALLVRARNMALAIQKEFDEQL